MNGPKAPIIQMISDTTTATPLDDVVVFVGGPLDGTRRTVEAPRGTIAAGGSVYRRSVHCADDGAIRYLFDEQEDLSDLSDGS